MLLFKLGSELPNLLKKIQSILKIWTKCRLNSHELEYFHQVECTPPSPFMLTIVEKMCTFEGLRPREQIFKIFFNRSFKKYVWVGASKAECIFLNDFR